MSSSCQYLYSRQKAQAKAKLLLLGEYSALWRFPALGMSLPQTLTVFYTPGGQQWQIVNAVKQDQPLLYQLIALLSQIAQQEGLPVLNPGRISIKSNIPCRAGFGSSAALCAALTQIFFPALSLDELDKLALKAESLFHGKASGIDNVLTLRHGLGVLWPCKNGKVPRFELLETPAFGLVAGAFERLSNTKTLVSQLVEKMQKGHKQTQDIIKELGQTALDAIEILKNCSASSITSFAQLTNHAQKLLERFGLNHPQQDALFQFAKNKTGALGSKLSGAGQGGAYFILYPHQEEAKKAVNKLRQQVGPCLHPPFVVEWL